PTPERLLEVLYFVVAGRAPTPAERARCFPEAHVDVLVPEDLRTVTAGTTRVRVTRVGDFDPRHRHRGRPLFDVYDPEALEALYRALEIRVSSLANQYALTRSGHLSLHFLRGHALLATVTYGHAGWVRWDRWRWWAYLRDRVALPAWLTRRGWTPPF